MRLRRHRFFAAYFVVAGLAHAASFDERVEALFRPPLGEMMALSPDGERVAYTSPSGLVPVIAILNLASPGPKRTVLVEPALGAPAPERQPVRWRFLRWATPNRLVFAPVERVVPLPPVSGENGRLVPNPDGPTIVSPIMAVDADGRQRGTLVDAPQFMDTPADARKTLADLLRTPKELQATRNEPIRWKMPHLDLLGFYPRDREQLIIQTRGAYSMPMLHLVDVRTGQVREFGDEWPLPPGEPQVFDGYRFKVVGERKTAARPTTTWRDVELASVQRQLETKFPRRTIDILDWTETRSRVLFRATGGRDPGRVFVFQRPEDLVLEILRCAPWLSASSLHETRSFEFDAPDGGRLSGDLTWPDNPRAAPSPLLVVFPPSIGGPAQPAFDPESQIFADMGFVVIRLNHRTGGGAKGENLPAGRGAIDRVSVDDAQRVIEWVEARYPDRPFNRDQVAALGRGFGGYLAVRALQLRSTLFRCGIAIDASLDFSAEQQAQKPAGPVASLKHERDRSSVLINDKNAEWQPVSGVNQAAAPTNPVLLLVEPKRNPAIDVSTEQLRVRLQELGWPVDYFELDPGFAASMPVSRAKAYRKIEEFLSKQLQKYAVNIGSATDVK